MIMTHKKELYIEIAGVCGTGKSTVAYAIGNILKAHGMKVIVLDDQYDDSEITPESIERNLTAIGSSGEVVIRSRQLMQKTL